MNFHSSQRRPFGVVPKRAALDRRLKGTELRVLMAIGHYANRVGVCWPSLETIEKDTGVDKGNASKAVQTLIQLGYLRRLEPGSFGQKPGAWGYSNRYQLMLTEDAPVPKWEEILDANPFQNDSDQVTTSESTGARGLPDNTEQHTRELAAYAAACERHTGARPLATRGAPLAGLEPMEIDAAVRQAVQRLGRLPSPLEVAIACGRSADG